MGSSRREFLFGLGAGGARPLFSLDRVEPDLILYNGNIWTGDRKNPRAEGIAVSAERIFAVGSSAEVLRLTAGSARKIDLEGKTVLPGFIDAHCHPADSGLDHLTGVDCDLRSIADIVAALHKRAAATPPGQWVLGFKYDDTKSAEGRALTRADLDAAVPDRPAYIVHRGGHTAWANSRAFEAAKVNEHTPDPPGGKFDRDSAGRLTGHVREKAKDVLDAAIAFRPTREQMREGVALISKLMARAGVTSVHDASASPEALRGYQDALQAGTLSTRVYCLMWRPFLDRVLASGMTAGMGNEWVRVGAVKLMCDGSISERTAWLSEPYVGRPNDHGIQVAGAEELYATARKAHEAGWQIGTHANGDAAIDLVLSIYERLNRELPRRDPRFRLEHCTVVNDGLIRRIKALGAIPTPFSSYVYFHGEKMKEYGPERVNRMFALRSFLDAGIPATQASDYEASPFEPMMALQSEVTRADSAGHVRGPAQKITLEEALRVGTINGAHASFEERLKGTLEPGKLADLVVLGKDPFKTDPSELIKIPVERTMVGGRWVWEA